MPFAQERNRRGFMKMLAASPLLAQITAHQLYENSAAAIGFDTKENVYSRLGVKTVINCRGTWTYLSGSLEFPEVREAQLEAAQHKFESLLVDVDKELSRVSSDWDRLFDSSADDAAKKKIMERMNEILNRRSYIRNLVNGVRQELAEA